MMKPPGSSTFTGTSARLAPVRTALDNGVVVVAKETHKTPAVSINLAVRAGSVCDPPDAPGAIHLLARSSDRGTVAHSAAEIAEALDGRGITLSIAVSRHLSSFVCTCLTEDFEAVLTLVAEIVMSPSLPETEVAMRKGEIVTALRQDEDSPYVRAVDGLLALLYG